MSANQPPDIRWKQRLENFERAMAQLLAATALSTTRPLSDLEKQGLIQAFEFSHELAWNLMRDYVIYQGGGATVSGSRDASREAFSRGLVTEGQLWMDMIQSRNLSSHTYNKTVSEEIVGKITGAYAGALEKFFKTMQALAKNEK